MEAGTRPTGLFLLQLHNLGSKLAIDIECFIFCDRVLANERMDIFYRFAANEATYFSRAGVICLMSMSKWWSQLGTVKILTCSTPE